MNGDGCCKPHLTWVANALTRLRINKACGFHMRTSMRGRSLKRRETHFSKPEKNSKSLSRSFPVTLRSDLALEHYLKTRNINFFTPVVNHKNISKRWQPGPRISNLVCVGCFRKKKNTKQSRNEIAAWLRNVI